jgi:hypothetical protein
MAKANPENYALAAGFIRSGAWVVDPEAGTIWSRKLKRNIGRKFDGARYHRLMIKHPVTGRVIQVSLHRVIWESVHGPLSPDLEVNHEDGNTSNNSIHNLEPLTTQANIEHAIRTGLRADRHIGVPGEGNHMARLTADDVREIRRLACEGRLSQKAIACRWGIAQATVSNIKTGSRWAHLT